MSCNHDFMPLTRRQALTRLGGGFGLVALSQMLNTSLAEAATTIPTGGKGGILPGLHFKPRAKRVIFLMMNGGVSHVDTFDYKPMLGGPVLTQRKTGNLMKSPFKFQKWGKSGLEMSELWPNLGTVADDMC